MASYFFLPHIQMYECALRPPHFNLGGKWFVWIGPLMESDPAVTNQERDSRDPSTAGGARDPNRDLPKAVRVTCNLYL